MVDGIDSSAQMSPRRSDISTNSSSNTFFTTFGDREAAGLYGPGVDNIATARTGSEGPGAVFVAVMAKVSLPEIAAREDSNVGINGSCTGFGISPSLVLPSVWGQSRHNM